MRFLGDDRLKFLAVFFVALSSWFLAGATLHGQLSSQNKEYQLQTTALQLMRRVEKAVDFVVIAGTELLIAGQTECIAGTEDLLRTLVLKTATVSDVYLVTPEGSCSSFGELSAELPAYAQRRTWTQAVNPAYRVSGVAEGDNGTILVSWGLDTDVELVSAISVDSALFDILPEEIRAFAHINLVIDGQVISRFSGERRNTGISTNSDKFSVRGERYPLAIEIGVDPSALRRWRDEIPISLLVGWAAFGALASLTAAAAVTRRHNKELEDVVRALTNQEISPYFQPIVDTYSGKVVGCEALARWIKPDGTSMPPSRFIPFVEKYSLNDELISAMVEQTARDLRSVIVEHPELYVSFNVTPDQLSRSDFADFLITLASKHFLPPSQICIEITERQVIACPDEAARTMEHLKAAGFRIALDDAGTGHNGMASLQKLRVDSIKIDKFFIDHITDDPRSRVMVDMFVSVAARYGMTTVAEGVENIEQFHALKIAGVDFLQGYLFERPLEASKLAHVLRDMSHRHADLAETAPPTPSYAANELSQWTEDGSSRRPLDRRTDRDHDLDEASRLAALYRFQLLDTPEEEAFDRIPRIIRRALNTPFAAIALIDDERRWFKATSGGERGELPRSQSFCNHTIQSAQPTVIEDTLSDERFCSNALVTGAPNIRAYLGVPLQTQDGYRIGSLCCIDTRPRAFSVEEIELVRDLSSIVMEQIELRTLTLFDTLTGIFSRDGFRSEIERRLGNAQSRSEPFSILMLDVDDFKQINDGYGHAVGDEVLAGLCQRFTAVLGQRHMVGRIGGDEFAFALFDVSAQAAAEIAESVRSAVVDTAFQTGRGSIPVTVSIGVTGTVQDLTCLDALLERADWALYEAKGQGRNCVRVKTDSAA